MKLQIKNYLRLVCFGSKENYTANDLEIEEVILKALKAFEKRQLDRASSIKFVWRRGFHNTYVFYGQINRLKDEIRKEQLDKVINHNEVKADLVR